MTSLSDSNAKDTSATASVASTEEVFTVCPVCDYRSRNQQALWQHINAEHIFRQTFPKIDFFTSHGRRICCICGFAYDKMWKTCRRSTGTGRSRCRGSLEDPHLSSWLQNPCATSESVDLNRTNETFESSTGSAIPRVIFSDNDLALKGMQAASDFLLGSTVIDENGVFEAVMDDIVRLPVQTIAHVSKSVRPLLAEVLMNELKHAQYGGIWGFVRSSVFAKATLRLPPRGGRRKRCVVSSLISSRLRRWQSGDLVSLWVEARADANANPSLSSPDQIQDCSQRNARKALSHAREGKFGSAIRILGSVVVPHMMTLLL